MKIDDSSPKLPPLALPAGKNAPAEPAATLPAARSENVSLSGTARIASGREAPIDIARVERVRAEIADGSFRIYADRIARDMIAGASELITQRR